MLGAESLAPNPGQLHWPNVRSSPPPYPPFPHCPADQCPATNQGRLGPARRTLTPAHRDRGKKGAVDGGGARHYGRGGADVPGKGRGDTLPLPSGGSRTAAGTGLDISYSGLVARHTHGCEMARGGEGGREGGLGDAGARSRPPPSRGAPEPPTDTPCQRAHAHTRTHAHFISFPGARASNSDA
jgi:hypothetical protein